MLQLRQSLNQVEESQMGEDTGNSKPDEQPTPPQVAPPAFTPVATDVVPGVKQLNPITLVLQWLTYAFWGWFALAMSWLSYVSFLFFTDASNRGDSDWSTIVAYPIAAVVVLFLMAAVTDFFYMRREPAHKTGVATAIMVIHTVIFALCGVGLVVAAVFTVIQLMLSASTSSNPGLLALLYMALVGVLIYAILVARTTLVAKLKRLPVIAMGILGAIALLFVVLCITGPMMRSLATKQDRQVESALSLIQSSVVDYTRENNKLPTSLDKMTFTTQYDSIKDADVKALLKKGVIEYTPNVKSMNKNDYGLSQDDYLRSSTVKYYYQLCATYTHDKNGSNSSRYTPYSESDSYISDGSSSSDSDYIDWYSHKAGRQCYTLQATSNNYSTIHPTPIPIKN